MELHKTIKTKFANTWWCDASLEEETREKKCMEKYFHSLVQKETFSQLQYEMILVISAGNEERRDAM